MPRLVRADKNLVPGHPAKPESLTEAAEKHWHRLAFDIAEAGIQLSPAHGASLALAAEIAADMDDARETVRIEGAYIQQKAGLTMHPAARRLDALQRDYVKILGSLGIRAAVAVPEQNEEETLDALLEG